MRLIHTLPRAATGRPVAGRPARPGRVRRGLIWLLLLALAVYAASSSMLRVVGPRHWHAAAGAPASALAETAGPGHGLHAASHHDDGEDDDDDDDDDADGPAGDDAHPPDHHDGHHDGHHDDHVLPAAAAAHPHTPGHTHAHSALLRHWHDAGDASVQLAPGEAADPLLAELKAAAAAGGATLLPALAPRCDWRLRLAAPGSWPMAPPPSWRSATLAPPLEPPRG